MNTVQEVTDRIEALRNRTLDTLAQMADVLVKMRAEARTMTAQEAAEAARKFAVKRRAALVAEVSLLMDAEMVEAGIPPELVEKSKHF